MDWGDSVAVNDIFTLCIANQPGSEPASTPVRQAESQCEPKTKMADPPPPQEAKFWIGLLGCDWVSDTGRGGGMGRKEQETQKDKGYLGLPRVTKGY